MRKPMSCYDPGFYQRPGQYVYDMLKRNKKFAGMVEEDFIDIQNSFLEDYPNGGGYVQKLYDYMDAAFWRRQKEERSRSLAKEIKQSLSHFNCASTFLKHAKHDGRITYIDQNEKINAVLYIHRMVNNLTGYAASKNHFVNLSDKLYDMLHNGNKRYSATFTIEELKVSNIFEFLDCYFIPIQHAMLDILSYFDSNIIGVFHCELQNQNGIRLFCFHYHMSGSNIDDLRTIAKIFRRKTYDLDLPSTKYQRPTVIKDLKGSESVSKWVEYCSRPDMNDIRIQKNKKSVHTDFIRNKQRMPQSTLMLYYWALLTTKKLLKTTDFIVYDSSTEQLKQRIYKEIMRDRYNYTSPFISKMMEKKPRNQTFVIKESSSYKEAVENFYRIIARFAVRQQQHYRNINDFRNMPRFGILPKRYNSALVEIYETRPKFVSEKGTLPSLC